MSVENSGPRRNVFAIALPGVRFGRFGRFGTATALIVGGILAVDITAIVATLWFGADLIDPAELARAQAIAEQLMR